MINQKTNAVKPFRPLKAKLLFSVLTISTVLTSLVIFFNFYIEYNTEIGSLRVKLQQINESSIPAINSAVWNVDKVYLTVLVESIVKIKDIVSVKVKDPRGKIIIERTNTETDGSKASDLMFYEYPLHHKHYNSSKIEHIGNVQIVASTTEIKENLYDRIFYFVFAQFLKTFILSWIILLIFHHYINKNIEQIVSFTQDFDLNSVNNKYLNIRRRTFSTDEFDLLQDSVNRMIEKINTLNTEKEKKITEQERKIEMQQMNAINSSKLVALGEMAGGVAHEINNPLAIIHTHTQLLERMIEKGNTSPEQMLKSTRSIASTVDRIKNIVKGLKNISRDATSEKPDYVPLRNVLQDVFSLCEERFKNHQVKLICDLEQEVFQVPIHCRQVQLSQVFLNLLNNSFDAVNVLPEKWIQIDAEKFNGKIKIMIMDSGKGIDPEIRQKIFQPFYTTKEIGKGTGLGLSLVHRMISDHGGEIYYDDLQSHTCFTIILPLD